MVKFELNSEGVRELLKSAEMEQCVSEYANKAVSRLGAGYEASTFQGKNRVNASVMAVTYEAKKENSKNNTILKAIR